VVALSRTITGIFLLCLLGLMPAQASLETQRQAFLQAEKALQKGQTQQYRQLRRQLGNYPLLPYLDLSELQGRLGKARHSEVRRFLKDHDGTPVADMLRRKWLDRLAKKKQWKSYLAFYTPQLSVTRQCHRLQALIETGKAKQAWPQVEEVWLHGKSRPSACDPVFAAWEKAGKRSDELTWQRIELAMHAGEWRLARYLGKKLDNQDSVWLSRWIRIHRSPRDVLRHADFTKPHPYREKMLAHTVRRMASFDGLEALSLWQDIEARYPFDQDTRYQTERRIALALERNNTPAAYAFILQQQPRADDERLFTARKRAALLRADWQQLLTDLEQGPVQANEEERWDYWKARALEATGQSAAARELFAQLATERSYYGFLAADRIGADYHLAHNDTPVDSDQLKQMRREPGIQRALELHALERDTRARREWNYATADLPVGQLKAAALIAEQADWRDQAIFTLAKTRYWDDLELRFPLNHQQLVEQQAQTHQLDSAWVFAVIRQESAFRRDARSHAGAMGLMQLMPATARSVAKRYLKRKPPQRSALFEAEVNIELGSAYLKQLLESLHDSPVLATAAYNAGPNRVDKWLPPRDLDADIWVDLVPFNETRRYLRRVLSYMVIYDKRLGREPKRLSERMATIAAAPGRIAGA